MTTLLRSCGCVLAFAVAAAAQRGTPGGAPSDEFVHLEPVLQAAIAKSAPFTVTVETFGGTRQAQGKEGPMDGEAPPKPRDPLKSKPTPKPLDPDKPPPVPPDPEDPDKKPPVPEEKPEQPGDKDKDKDKDKPKKPLVASGFQQTQGKTTGVVLSADGWILVSRFALALEPTTVLITVPGRGTFRAVRAGEDTSRGIALVKIDAANLPVPEFVHPDQVQVGQWAFALGRTFATDEPTVHLGIVSAKRRLFGRALQIDAYTSPANYGGPVVDLQGRVLGIAVPLSPTGRNAGVEWYDSGIGFATTVADIQPLLARMQNGEVLQRGWLGVQLESAWLGPGAKIAAATKDGAADKAGLKAGDVIVKVDGTAVRNGPHFQMLLSSHLGGDKVHLDVRRGDGSVEPVGPVALLDAPWSEQVQKKEAELPASFPLPEKKDQEGGR
jgi:S1-C subfamily serine protease